MNLLLNKYAAMIAAALAIILACYANGIAQYRKGVSDTKMAAQIEAAARYKAEVERMNSYVAELQQNLMELQNEKPKVITKYRDRVATAPLSADCRIDDERLRNIQDGIRKARSISGP